ncbi:hypothetical protein [Limnoglobus roseus]|uniref:SMI1/KNR4 family protein n=1 Tax=Limnoglobus roseus TaxID=2598579 RepID=A0A5C1AL38_9BACT|nr:hypothetical protein [Limnoglobus roseus]QEL18863.1 SMI1/KNR4 family protein [Limnoglobus roseus]
MTEAEWRRTTDPGAMLDFLHGRSSGRKLRLFACACCRPLFTKKDLYHGALDVAEEVAEGKAPRRRVRELELYATMAMEDGGPLTWSVSFALAPDLPKNGLNREFTDAAAGLRKGVSEEEDAARFVGLLRCVFGNPFRPVTFSPSWLTPTAVSLAEAIYTDRAFDRLPILADALQDAGCENAAILGHCRGDGVHVRGCWVVDGVLGKG